MSGRPKRFSKDWVEAYYEYGVDLVNRRVWMNGYVDEDTIGYAIKSIYLMEAESVQPIELLVSSFGGSEYEMFGLYDVLRASPCDIKTLAVGKCMSAAPLLVAAGEPGLRKSMPNTSFMFHQGWVEPYSMRREGVEAELRHFKKVDQKWYELMALHTKKNADFWKDLCAKVEDTYVDAKRAKTLGLIDYIVGEDEEEE